jgi:hypothetical protein
MSRTFKSSSKWVRSGFAAAAVLSTVLVMVSIEGLIQHYEPPRDSWRPVGVSQADMADPVS